MIIYDNFFDDVLLAPAKAGADNLKIISGYASSAMASHHLELISQQQLPLNISLLVGMTALEGISQANHRGFIQIQNKKYPKQFTCNYVHKLPQVHSKLYIWSKGNKFHSAFLGSANYTQKAFYGKQQEILSPIYDSSTLDYFAQLETRSITCIHHEIENFIRINKDKNRCDETFEKAVAPLFSLKKGHKYVPDSSGLNWGQRPQLNREPNQAYIRLTPEVYRSNFFPAKPQHFTVVTDDDHTLICTRAQKSSEGQAIQTPLNNSLLGEYFRNRLGVANGEKVTMEHLVNYGRDEVTFYKIDDENFYMDFSN